MTNPTEIKATVVSIKRITPDDASEEVKEVVLDLDQPGFNAEAGQSIAVLAPAPAGSEEEHHVRYYSLSDFPESSNTDKTRVALCVRRCHGTNAKTGKEEAGIASNYLCDLKEGDTITTTGPFGIPFEIPEDKRTNLVLIGSGTGIAPFRAFVKNLYGNSPDWKGRVWLFYGARSGLELLYMNDANDDLTNYYDQETFKAFNALSPDLNWADPLTWDMAFAERGSELMDMLDDSKTCFYIAGLRKMVPRLDKTFSDLHGSAEKWQKHKDDLISKHRWMELLY